VETDSAIFKARNADVQGQGESTKRTKINTPLPVDQNSKSLFFVKRTTDGGRKNHKTISNKNKKKHNKLSRRRRHHHHSKKNRKSMKRK
jgi:hypothetical protein